MMRLLFLCLLLPAAPVFSEDGEGSGDPDWDDEDFVQTNEIPGGRSIPLGKDLGSVADKTTGVSEAADQFTTIVIVVAVSVVALTVAAIVAIVLVRRHMHSRQQGVYSVPAEQGQKGAV